jgi:hypothetical protein
MLERFKRFILDSASKVGESINRYDDLQSFRDQMPCFKQDLLLSLIDQDSDYRNYQYGAPGAARVFNTSETPDDRYNKLGALTGPIESGQASFSRLRSSRNPKKISRELRIRLVDLDHIEYDYFDTPKVGGHSVLQHFPYGQPLTPETYDARLKGKIENIITWNRQLYRDTGYVLDLTPSYPKANSDLELPHIEAPGIWLTRGGELLVSSTTFLTKKGDQLEQERAKANMSFMTFLEIQMGKTVFS